MKNNNLKNDIMNDSALQKVYICNIYLTHSKVYSDEGFVNNENGSMSGSH